MKRSCPLTHALIHITPKPSQNPQRSTIWKNTKLHRQHLTLKTNNLVCEIHVRYPDKKFRLVWTPGHQGVEGNETAHRLTLENSPGPVSSWPAIYSVGATRNARRALRKSRLKEQCEERTIYPHPPKTMSRQQSSLVRQAQTNSLPLHYIFHHIYKRPDSPTCPKCGEYPSIPHTYWSRNPPTLPPTLSHIISWEEWLALPMGTDIPTALEALINHSSPLAESIRETCAGRTVRTRT